MDELLKWLDAERGRRVALAQRLGIGPSALSQWRQVPADRVRDVETATGISRTELRPDLYGPVVVAGFEGGGLDDLPEPAE